MVNGVNTVYVDGGHGIFSPKGKVEGRIESASTRGRRGATGSRAKVPWAR